MPLADTGASRPPPRPSACGWGCAPRDARSTAGVMRIRRGRPQHEGARRRRPGFQCLTNFAR
jgi:hypothetical protein